MRIVLLAALLSVSPVVAAAAPAGATKTATKTAPKPAATATHAPAKATPAASAATGAAAKTGGPRTSVLANGMHVVIAPDSSAATVDVSLWFPAGSRDERAGKTGVTQVVNGLLFAGSRNYPPGEHQRLIDREGGTSGVFALADFASVNETVPPASLELALRLEADRMGAANLDAPSLEAVRAAIERSRRDPSTRSGVALGVRKLYETAFQGHSYRWPAAGLDADLAKLTLEDARTWWRDRYGPDGTWLVISGRCDPDSAEALARRTLGAVPKRGVARAAVPPPAAQTAARRSRGTLEGAGRVLLVGWRTSGARSADAAAMNVLDALLTHRRPSRIEGALIADSSRFLAVQAGFDQRRDAGLLFVAVLTDVDSDSLQLERDVIRAVEQGAAAASDDDLDGALRQNQVESLFAWQTPAGAGSAMGRAAMLTGSPSAAAALESARRLTPEALRQSAARQLTAGHRTVVWMLPGSPPGAASGAPDAASGARKGGR
jgi:zinc protease